ncbi:hypothetical protein A2673_04265 [Candidatus Kaiserbacteria bacterium RIFCSPHIGHO2_01_FULL_50_13]|uniref:Uncharacterized protein n=1 Tax=Candidatus Kaiserbacteria bacterium RIFCSPLOWO2_01_FULL_50_24 TaxID=1798507 RepID=A0A1F6EMF9_9BACT|nr:MAG: hypothetical protein A2673_04265 [Candidatus Kaiserbacteria bacterium RIFCSPHIGHO2_01_FULL_50_13]OGG74844.1 MAG: hypothetical protein A3A34_03115 [Candidatus Kaiserbacteria bacterium RIFCSPLOWO2_01_FULL_50_24]OGG81656.1 MAG: hypothetical protein A3H74_00780 [Candidatus Kaiserbacteria bacterium RIFCSPLOWO2_02_FULL_51_13]
MKVEIIIVREPIIHTALEPLAKAWHGTLVKGVADCKRDVFALGGEWHMDANNVLIADGSAQQDLWGFNVYPKERGESAIEYISLVNIRPSQGNRGMEIEDSAIRENIAALIHRFLPGLDV